MTSVLSRAQWLPNLISCPKCGEDFKKLVRRHHCRVCGQCFCHDCSSWRVPAKGSWRRVRSCYDCYEWCETQRRNLQVTHTLSKQLDGLDAESVRRTIRHWYGDDDDAASECSVATTRRRRAQGKATPASTLRKQARRARHRATAPREEGRLTRAALDALEEETKEPPPDSCATFAADLRSAVNARQWDHAESLLRQGPHLHVDHATLETTKVGKAVGRLARDSRVPSHVKVAAARCVDAWRNALGD